MNELDFAPEGVDADALSAGFSEHQPGTLPATGPVGSPVVTVENGVITAQKVAVPRNLPKVMQELKALASAAGENWYYRWPVKNKDGTRTWVEGPSIKLANDLARTYGNCQVDVRAFDQGDTWMFYARFVDVETGYSLTRAFQQRKDQQTIKTKDAGRALDIVFQIGQSKAIRNVSVNALQTLADFAVEEAKNNIIEKVGKQLDGYREKVLSRLSDLSIDVKRVEAVIGRTSKDWLAHDVARIIAEIQSINDGIGSADDIYPPDAPAENPKRGKAAKTREEDSEATVPTEDGGAIYVLESVGGKSTVAECDTADEFAEKFLDVYEGLTETDRPLFLEPNLEMVQGALDNVTVPQLRAGLEAVLAAS